MSSSFVVCLFSFFPLKDICSIHLFCNFFFLNILSKPHSGRELFSLHFLSLQCIVLIYKDPATSPGLDIISGCPKPEIRCL